MKTAVEKAAAGSGKITKLEAIKTNGQITGYEATVVKAGKTTGLEVKPGGSSAK